jgi:hypothetical protein
MPALGDSNATIASRAGVVRLFEVFRQDSTPPIVSVPLDKCTTQKHVLDLCQRRVFDLFVVYVTEKHRGPTGEPLAWTTVLVYLGIALNLAKKQASTVRTDDATKHITQLFFTCLDGRASTDIAVWYRRLKDLVARSGFQYCIDNGKDTDNSEEPLYPCEMAGVCRALSLHGTAESASR